MARTIKEVFAEELKHLKIDLKLVKAIGQFERHFVNKSEDHIAFLGGNLLGTPPLRFHSSDRNNWFDEVLRVDDVVLKNELHALPSVDPTQRVRTDVYNLSCVWLVHAIHTTSNLSARQKEQGMMDALRAMHYRFLSSLMAHNFKYEPDRTLAEATYAALSYKFALKQKGSWAALIEARCEDILSRNSIHSETIERFDDDQQVQYMVGDIQGRIREIVKKMVHVFYEVQKSPTRVQTRSSLVDLDGQMHVRDLTRQNSRYKRYINTTLSDRSTFIRSELVGIVGDVMHTMPERHLTSALEYMADNYGRRGDPKIQALIDETLLHAFEYIGENRQEFRNSIDLATLIGRLRSLYMSSRSTDPSLLKMRDLSLAITKRAVKSNNKSLLAAVRTGCMVYIVLRTFTMNYYSQGGSTEERSHTPELSLVAAVL